MTPPPRLVPDRPSDAALAKAFRDAVQGTSGHMLRDAFIADVERRASEIDAAAPPAEAPANLDAAIIREASEVLEAVGASGVALPANWRWPLADELYGMSLLAEAPAERGGFPFVEEMGPTGKPTGYLLRKDSDTARRDYDLFFSNVRAALGEHYDAEAGLICSIALLVAEKDRITAPRVTGGREVIVSAQGVQFGPNCWISHEQITGMSAVELNARSRIVAKQYMAWVDGAALQAATGGEG